jgi:hypothetical protein
LLSKVFKQFLKVQKAVLIKESQKKHARILLRSSHQMGGETAVSHIVFYCVTPLSNIHHHFDVV